jgi:ankyrin repeat protein
VNRSRQSPVARSLPFVGAVLFALLLSGCGGKSRPTLQAKSIHEAARIGDTQAVEEFLARGVPVESKDASGDTALHVAAECGQALVVRLLLEKGANIEAERNDEYRPLVLAANDGHIEVVRLLLDRGAVVDPPKPKDGTPFYWAKRGKHKAVVELLRSRGAKCPPSENLYEAIKNWDTEAVKRFIAQGVPVNEPDAWDSADLPLHHAAQLGFVDIAEILLDNGADINAAVGQQKFTPLHKAVFYENMEMVRFLLRRRAKVNPRDHTGQTPLDWAPKVSKPELREFLKKHGAK